MQSTTKSYKVPSYLNVHCTEDGEASDSRSSSNRCGEQEHEPIQSKIKGEYSSMSSHSQRKLRWVGVWEVDEIEIERRWQKEKHRRLERDGIEIKWMCHLIIIIWDMAKNIITAKKEIIKSPRATKHTRPAAKTKTNHSTVVRLANRKHTSTEVRASGWCCML